VIRIAQLGLVVAAAALWGASRMTWVDVTSFDGLGQPRTTALSGASWSTALVPLAVLLLATAVAALAVRGWLLRALAVIAAITSAGMAYLAITLWVMRDVGVRASHLADVPVADLVGTQRHYGGAVITVIAAVVTLTCAAFLLRSAGNESSGATRYARRGGVTPAKAEDAMSERQLWDALDEGLDPTQDRPTPDKGR
jgi:uncharacterized membrane protein (TIGR02234 family)